MSKAEEKSLIAYPQKIQWVGNQWDGAPFDVNSESRVAYKQGYEQAEKDLKLSWEDIVEIDKLLIDLGMMFPVKSTPDYYDEVLKRFKDFKERKQQ